MTILQQPWTYLNCFFTHLLGPKVIRDIHQWKWFYSHCFNAQLPCFKKLGISIFQRGIASYRDMFIYVYNTFPKEQKRSQGCYYDFCEGRYFFKLISDETLCIAGMLIELNFRNKKRLLCCSYNPNKTTISDHLEILRRNLDFYSAQYESLIMISDFNSDVNQSCMKAFCLSYNLSSLIKESTYYQNHKILHA